MPERNVAVVVFWDKEGNFIFQKRGSASKVGEKYGWWGGQIEAGETPEQAIRRELLEELGFVPEKLDFWRHLSHAVVEEGKYHGWKVNEDVFLSPITPGLEKTKTYEGEGMVKMAVDEAIASQGFSIHGTEFLKILRKELFSKDGE